MNKIHFSVVGFGHIGKRHAAIINGLENAQLDAVADIDFSLFNSKDAKPSSNCYKDISELLKSEKSEVVSICTPNHLHVPMGLECLEKGRHIIVEKPMALSGYEGKKLIEKAKEKGKSIFCVMQNRYSPPAQWLKEIISGSLLGKIYMIQVNCFWNRDHRYYKSAGTPHPWRGKKEMDGGTIFTQFSHFVDMLHWLFGEMSVTSSNLYDFNHKNMTDFEDSGIVLFSLPDGGTGTLNFSTCTYNKNLESSMIIIGEKGTIKIDGQYMNKVSHCEIENYTMPKLPETNAPNRYGSYSGSAANHEYVFKNVIDVLNGRSEIDATAEEGNYVVSFIEEIYDKGQIEA